MLSSCFQPQVWDDVTNEERLAKRLKRGKITQEEFDSMTMALDKKSMNPRNGRGKAIGAVDNKRRMVPQMMAKIVAEDSRQRKSNSMKGNRQRSFSDEDEDAIEHAKEILRQHTERVVAAKRKHRFSTKNIK